MDIPGSLLSTIRENQKLRWHFYGTTDYIVAKQCFENVQDWCLK